MLTVDWFFNRFQDLDFPAQTIHQDLFEAPGSRKLRFEESFDAGLADHIPKADIGPEILLQIGLRGLAHVSQEVGGQFMLRIAPDCLGPDTESVELGSPRLDEGRLRQFYIFLKQNRFESGPGAGPGKPFFQDFTVHSYDPGDPFHQIFRVADSLPVEVQVQRYPVPSQFPSLPVEDPSPEGQHLRQPEMVPLGEGTITLSLGYLKIPETAEKKEDARHQYPLEKHQADTDPLLLVVVLEILLFAVILFHRIANPSQVGAACPLTGTDPRTGTGQLR